LYKSLPELSNAKTWSPLGSSLHAHSEGVISKDLILHLKKGKSQFHVKKVPKKTLAGPGLAIERNPLTRLCNHQILSLAQKVEADASTTGP
jgi:hypothetical protein